AFRIQFTAPLDPRRPLDTAAVRGFALPDTTPVAVRALFTSAQYDSLQARARALADSLRRAKDPTARARPPAPAAQRAPALAGPPPPPRAPIGRDTTAARVDTTKIR